MNAFSGWITCVVLTALLAGGCGRNAQLLDRMEERDPLLKRARLLKSRQDIPGAIAAYHKALERKPNLARAHLEVGFLYDGQQDYLRAIYHYQRYLELRPDADKKSMVEDMIRHAIMGFAASLPEQPSGAIAEIAMLRREVEALRARLAETATPRGTPTAAAPAEASKPAPPQPEPARPPVTTYVVQPGDTLSRIAGKVYGDPAKWNLVYDANRNTLSSPESIKVGQTLIIPR